MRKIAVFLFVTLLFALLSVTSFATAVTAISDRTDMLTAEEENAINAALTDSQSRTGINYYIYLNDATSGAYASEREIMETFGVSDYDDTVILLVEKVPGGYEYEPFAYGEAYSILSTDADAILDDTRVYNAIKAGRLANGITAFASLSADFIIDYRHTATVTVIVISVIIALLAGGTAFGIVLYKYKKKLKSPIYPLNRYANLRLDYSTDHFLGSSVTRTRVSSSRSSGGGSRGGGSLGRR